MQLNHALSYKNPNFDLGMRHWIVNHCKHDTTYIDIGANVGTFCGIAARHITQGKIIAIEPLTEMENSIRMNVQLNNPLVEFHHFGCAIGENEGKIFSKFMSLIIGCHHYIFKKYRHSR